jgi:rhomboid protease GluP
VQFLFIPWLTVGIAGVLCAIYAFEQHLALMGTGLVAQPSLGVVIALGGLSRRLIEQGEGYRILSAPLLHANLQHLVGNLVVFVFAGYRLERQVGRAWTFCVFAAGGLAGSVMSVLLSNAAMVTVGASGAIMAMLAALFFVSFRLPDGAAKTRAQRWVVFLLVPALIPLSGRGATNPVDYACHFGGTLVGAVLGLLLLLSWREQRGSDCAQPALRVPAALVSVGAILAFASSAYGVNRAYPAYASLAHMMPDGQVPRRPVDVTASAYRLLHDFPNDPRAHLVVAEAELLQNNATSAEAELRTALALADVHVAIVYPALNNVIRSVLAETVLAQRRRAEATSIAREACVAAGNAAPPEALLQQLEKRQLCDGRSGNAL